MAKGQLPALRAKGVCGGVALCCGAGRQTWGCFLISPVCPVPHPTPLLLPLSPPFRPPFLPRSLSPFPLPLGLLSSLPSLPRYPQGSRDTLTWHSAGLVHGLACSRDPCASLSL